MDTKCAGASQCQVKLQSKIPCRCSRCIPSLRAQQSLGTWRRHRATRPWRSDPCECLRHMLTSVINLPVASASAATTAMPSSSQNFVLATNKFVKKSTREGLQSSTTVRFRGNGQQNDEAPGFGLPLLVALASASVVVAAVCHGHQLIPTKFCLSGQT